MNAIKIFVIATMAGMGLTVGVIIILGWIWLIRAWTQPFAEQTQAVVRFLI